MSHSAHGECDDKIKSIIHHLYKVKNLPLQGSDQSVQQIMEQKYGFDRTKQQYEKLLADWGFTKKRKRKDYQTIEWRVQKRSKLSKASVVYLDGKLLPVKTWHRQGSLTMPERMKFDKEIPETPMGFEIRTPTAQPLSHLAFWNLPILQFQSGFDMFKDTISISKQTFESLIPVQRGRERSGSSAIMTLMSLVLPMEALRDEPAATSLAIDRMENLGSTEFLALTVYLMSNNFFGKHAGREAYKWLNSGGKARASAIILMIASVDGFTGKALLENIFRLAVIAGDTSTVEALLDAGVDPNGHLISHSRIPDIMEPLQFACVTGRFEMARSLIKAGMSVQMLESKYRLSFWKRSLIVLAIIGENNGLEIGVYDCGTFSHSTSDDGDGNDDDSRCNVSERNDIASSDKTSNRETRSNNRENLHFQTEKVRFPFHEFVEFLINEGATVNVDSVQDCSVQHLKSGFPQCLRASHSPLTAASKYRHSQIVRLLLANGAYVGYVVDGKINALQQCLSRTHISNINYGMHEIMFKPRSWRNESLPGIVRDLVNAGTEINTDVYYGYQLHHMQNCDCGLCLGFHFSSMDLAVFAGIIEVLDILFDAGATFSTHCLQYATMFGSLEVVEWLLGKGATIAYKPNNIFSRSSDEVNIKSVLKRFSDNPTKRFVMLMAIRLNSTSLMDYVMAQGPFEWASLFEFPDLLRRILKSHLSDIPERDACRKLKVVSRMLNLGDPGPLELWQHLSFSIHKALKKHPEAKIHRNGDIYAELVRAALKIGIPMQFPKKCCVENCRYQPGEAMLIIAIQMSKNDLISLLIDSGVNVNAFGNMLCGIQEQRYQTPLTTAITVRSRKSIECLLEAGANVNNPVRLPGVSQSFALCTAISEGYSVLVRSLLAIGAKFDEEALQLLGKFCETNYESFRFSLETRHSLITNHDLSNIVFTLVQGLLNPTIRDRVTQSMISIATEGKNLELLSNILAIPTLSITSTTYALGEILSYGKKTDLEVVRLLLGAGANANGVFRLAGQEHDLLHLAVSTLQVTTVKVILHAGGDPSRNLHPSIASTALQEAINDGNFDIIFALLEHGANPNASSPHKPNSTVRWGTPLQMAVGRALEEVVNVLLAHKADPDKTNQFVAHTPLQIAARKGLESVVNILIENGANVNAPPVPDRGATALQYSVIEGLFGIVHLLVQNGADVNGAGAEIAGRTALEAAAEHGKIDIVRYLLNVGAEVHGSGQQQYERALWFATGNGHHSIRELLEEHHG